MTCKPFLIIAAAGVLLSACATTPLTPLPPTNPASPQAPETPMVPIRNSLATDEATKKTTDLLAAGEKGTLMPPSMQPDAAPSNNEISEMPGMNMGGSHANH